MGGHFGAQFRIAEWLAHVVVGSQSQPYDGVLLGNLRREEQDGAVRQGADAPAGGMGGVGGDEGEEAARRPRRGCDADAQGGTLGPEAAGGSAPSGANAAGEGKDAS